MPPKTKRRHLLGTTLEEFSTFCANHDLPAYRAKQVYEWIYARGAGGFEQMTNLAKPLRQMLAEQWAIWSSSIVRRLESSDGTIKLLLAWPDEATSEAVLIPDGERRTACISSQVGCPVGCRFCASGLNGLQRQLTAGEIVEQAMRVRELCEPENRLSNVVFMGLGEPLANYAAMLKAVRIINAAWGMNIGARRITVSTVGLPTQVRRLAGESLQINLALSLHAPNQELRRELIPWASKIPLDELVDAVRYYFERTGREVTLEYILLAGVNDQPEHAIQLVALCRRMRCNVNLIRYNPVAGLGYERPSSYASQRFLERLRERGVNAHVRKSRGLDIQAACGQLRRSVRPVAAS
jgi:23S rRNA (adenine2503-C2)-methyltransferase